MWLMTGFGFLFSKNYMMLCVGVRTYEISRVVEQERNRVSVIK
jgi:hypothetical protein